MQLLNHRNKTVNLHQFAMVPKADIPRSTFVRQQAHKTTFDENWLIPFYVDEVLPGDTFSMKATVFARLSTPLFPVMDNMYLDSFYFFVPNRLIWNHWVNMMGEQTNPADSISFTTPQIVVGGGVATGTIYDYMGIPNAGQFGVGTLNINALPLRAYNKIWNDWFRDENLQNSVGYGASNLPTDIGDGPDPLGNYTLLKRGKRHDYFTAALPWTQKGGVAVTLPLSGTALVKTSVADGVTGAQQGMRFNDSAGARPVGGNGLFLGAGSTGTINQGTTTLGAFTAGPLYPTNLYADLSTATATTINALRQSFQIQKLLERDARGGTRYTELLRQHFGVTNPDSRLQRSEYLGGGSTPINIAPIPQTAQTGLTGGTTPLGTLGAHAAVTGRSGFTQSFTEHGFVIGLVNVRADLTYQQGLRKMWSRLTRYDHYWPAFAMLGEQAILNQEIYMQGTTADTNTFGFVERWAEYRYLPSMITCNFRSTATTPLDAWHLAEKFTSLPTLGATFIQQNTPVARVIATSVTNNHFIFDSFLNIRTTRAMPLYSVPGMIDHF